MSDTKIDKAVMLNIIKRSFKTVKRADANGLTRAIIIKELVKLVEEEVRKSET